MRDFIYRDPLTGTFHLAPAYTLPEQKDLFQELVGRVESLEAGLNALEEVYRRQIVDLTVETANIKSRLERIEQNHGELTEAVVSVTEGVQSAREIAELHYQGIIASLDQIRTRLGEIESKYAMADVYRLPEASELGEAVGADNLPEVVAGLAQIVQRDGSRTSSRLLQIESKLFGVDIEGSLQSMQARITDMNMQLAAEINVVRLRIDTLTKKLSLPIERLSTPNVSFTN